MTKIGKSHEGQILQKTGTLKKAVYGTDRLSVKKHSFTGQRPIITRQEMIDTALKSLGDQKLSLPGKSLSSIRALLSLIKQYQPAEGSTDLVLAERFLGRWIDTWGPEIPDTVKKELVLFKQFLKGEHDQLIQDRDIMHYQEGMAGDPLRSFIIYRETGQEGKKKDSPVNRKDEGSLSCVLDMDFSRLGPVKVLLKKDGDKSLCYFYSGGSSTRRLIRKTLSGFAGRIRKAALALPEMKVKARFPFRNHRDTELKELGLWG